MGDRALAPVVSKSAEVAIALAYVTLVGGVLFGGVVPGAQAATADALGDRTATAAALAVEGAVPADGQRVQVTRRLGLPETIRGSTYTIRATTRQLGGRERPVLVLERPGRPERVRPLSVPRRVDEVDGQWHSADGDLVVRVAGRDALTVTLRGSSG